MVIKNSAELAKVKRVAVLDFTGKSHSDGSGKIVASIFEKEFLALEYEIIERREVESILREHKLNLTGTTGQSSPSKIGRLLGVDAVILGEVTLYSKEKEQTYWLEVRETERQPVVKTVQEKIKQGDKWVTVNKEAIIGYEETERVKQVPQRYSQDAEVGMAVRMVDTATGKVLWSASDSEEGLNLHFAAQILAEHVARSLQKELRKISKFNTQTPDKKGRSPANRQSN